MNIEKKLNIGLFIDTFYPMIDGVVSVVDNYAKRLVNYANVTVFTVAPRDKSYVDNFTYKVVRSQKIQLPNLDYDLPMPGFDAKFQKALKESNLDIVHIHSPFSIGRVGVNYAKKHKIPLIATNHSQFKQDFFKATNSPALTEILLSNIMSVFNSCDENWSVNGEVAKIYADYGLKNPAKVVRNATDMNFIENINTVLDLKEKYNIKDDEKVLLFVGRIDILKNVLFLLDSLVELRKKGFKFKMLFVGSGIDEDTLSKKIEENNMSDVVKMVGRITDRNELAKFYKLANLFLFPSMYDCSSLVQVEAASQKTPTLFLENSTTSEGITDCFNGYLAKQDANEFANKIVAIFADENKYNQVCENCYNTVYTSWDSQIEKIFETYKKLIKEKKLHNRAVAEKAKYTKTIRAVQKNTQKMKEKLQKKQSKIKKNAQKYPKTIKQISNKRGTKYEWY